MLHFLTIGMTPFRLVFAGVIFVVAASCVYLFLTVIRSFAFWVEFGDMITVRYLLGETYFDYDEITGVNILVEEDSGFRKMTIGFLTGDTVTFGITSSDQHFLQRRFNDRVIREDEPVTLTEAAVATPAHMPYRRNELRKTGAVLRTIARCSTAAAFCVGATGIVVFLLAPPFSLQREGGLAAIQVGFVATVVSMLVCIVAWV